MSKRLIVKISKRREEFILDQGETYDGFIRILTERLGLAEGKTVKLLAKGKIINSESFSTLENGTILLGIETILPQNYVQNQDKNQIQAKKQELTPTGPVYSYDQVKASMIVFLDFIRTNKQTRDLYENNYGQLITEIIHNQSVNDVIKNILEQSETIMDAMKTGKNITIDIGSSESSNDSDDKISLSKNDDQNIQELIEMGFDPMKVVRTYIGNGNDKEKTLKALMNYV